MAVRRFVRGTADWTDLEAVARELARRFDEPLVKVTFLEADNWLSTPLVVNEDWFVKVITPQNSLVHALITAGRNLGAFSAGTEGFFEHVGTPLQMAERELDATRRMREIGVNAPEPIEAFEVDGLGVLVMEYLPAFGSLGELDPTDAEAFGDSLFAALARMHDHGLVHGDLRAENVLVQDGDLFFIDATTVSADRITAARAYDLACGLAVLAAIVGAAGAVSAASRHYEREELLEAREFLDFVTIRPDHSFDAAHVKAEIEKRAT